ncbi:shikimate dehydrogenase [Marinicella sp. W31]|uniref:shikimate dehydrogenase n=1 Tax=Marinicella sp. W31 TaxID=3023713 RepID=UPI003756434D
MKHNESTQQLALFGHPVKHSKSPEIHQGFAQQFGLDINYQLVDINGADLKTGIQEFFANGGVGANVTVPHKFDAHDMVDVLHDDARASGAVNTIVQQDKQLIGHNTDGLGLVTDLKDRVQFDLSGKTLLIFGAGGATAGILPALARENPKRIWLCNRTLEKAENLADRYAPVKAFPIEETFALTDTCDLIINATAQGHSGTAPTIPTHILNRTTIAYDLSYGKIAQPFFAEAQRVGIEHTYDGIGMLHHQAAYAFEIWFHRYPKISTD